MGGRGAPDLPDFPWDTIAEQAALARSHPDGVVDLSVGTPVDPTPPAVQAALAAAANAPGYPYTAGTPAVRAAATGWLRRRFGAEVPDEAVLPTIGSKELVAWLPTLLGARRVGVPPLAYPTYAVGALLAGAEPVVTTDPAGLDLLWVNSPSNPTGEVLAPDQLARLVAAARAAGCVLVSDECYADLYDEGSTPPVSALSPEVCGGSLDRVLALHSLSKRSNLAGYRAAFVAGDPALVARLLAVRKHAGMIVPAPVQAAMVAALSDDEAVAAQRVRYGARRAVLGRALAEAGFTVAGQPDGDDAVQGVGNEPAWAGLYLWASRGEPCLDTVTWLAQRGILVAPGSFYGAAGAEHVRVAVTATDERVAAAAARLAAG